MTLRKRGVTMRISARNHIRGVVVEFKKGTITSHVRVDIGGNILTSAITSEAIDESSQAGAKIRDMNALPPSAPKRNIARASPSSLGRDSRLAQRFERGADFRAKQLRLLPRRKMAALVDLVEIDQLGISLLRPASRRLIVLTRKNGDGGRNRDIGGHIEVDFVFPI